MTWLWVRHPFMMMRLKQGYCPLCNSSPPDPKCIVCAGTREYGPKATSYDRGEWLFKLRKYLKEK